MAKVLLGDVVNHIKDKVDKDTTDLEFYVGGEHIDGDEIMVRRKGRIEGSTIGPAFHMRFQRGDVLLMSRNPHLRKASMVDFDGICSDVSYVCRTKDEGILLQSLLPFILQTSEFWQFAEENKKGGLPFFLNWKDFARFEFELIPIEQQRQISDLLWAVERVKNAYRELIARTDDLVKSQFIEMFGLPDENVHGYEVARIGDVVCDVHYGTSRKASDDGEYTYLRMNNITYGGELDLTDIKRISIPEKELAGCMVKKGDVLFNRTNSRDLVGKTCAFNLEEPMVIAGYIIRLRMNGRILPEYLSAFLNLDSSKKMLFEMAKGAVGQANINAQEVQSIQLIVPPMEAQLPFQRLVEQSDKSKFAAQQTLKELTNAQKALMKKIFE